MSATKYLAASVLFLIAMICSEEVLALENGTSGYPRGIVTVMSGAVGSRGETYLYTYNFHTDIDSIKDGDGDKVFPHAKGGVRSHALRLVHVLERAPKILGGDLALEVAVPYIDGHIDVPVLGPNVKNSSKGLGDPLFGALISWASPVYLHNVEISVIAPWGKYEQDNLISPAAHTAAGYLAYGFSWFPRADWEISSKISVNYHFENNSTDYQSGIQLVADYGFNYRLSRQWLAGIGGFISTQLNDDQQSGRDVGNRSRSTKIGPQVGYTSGNWGFFASYHKDVFTRNSPSGDTVMLNAFVKL